MLVCEQGESGPDSYMRETRILSGNRQDLEVAAEELRNGGLVAVPTETVYGLAARGLDADAVARIYEVKERPLFDPLILHLPPSWQSDIFDHGLFDAAALPEKLATQVLALAEAFWPGPLTLVLPKTGLVPDITTSGLDTVAVRIPRHPLTGRLLDMLGFPLAAPSANRFGRISPTSAGDVVEELEGRIRYVLDGGECEIGLESTVIRIRGDGEVQLLRPGRITRAELSRVLDQGVVEVDTQDSEDRAQHSPGRLSSHYAPAHELLLFTGRAADEVEKVEAHRAPAVLFFSDATLQAYIEKVGAGALEGTRLRHWRVLSPAGDPALAGRNLFHMLRELDSSDASVIMAELPPDDTGISHAIRDRLERAAS